MKYSKTLQLCVVILISFVSSCNKDNESTPTDILTSKTWKLALMDKNTTTNPPGRILYYAVLDCQKDDTFQFNSNGTLTVQQGTNKCNTNEQAINTLSYTYDRRSKELVIDGVNYTLAEESKSQIKYYAPLSSNTGYDYLVFLLE